jgi:short-subunit dehydrogenase
MKLRTGARVVITGAGSGFGRAVALELASRRGHLVLGDVNVESLEETAKMARERGASSTKILRCDVTKLADVEALAAACDGMIDLVVNNAGVSSGGIIGELPIEDWRWTIEVDLWGVIHGCHVFVPKLRRQGTGHILNVASAAGLLSAPRMAAYNVAKAGVVSLSETLAAELVGSRVGVTVLCPTFFKTNIVANGRFTHPDLRAMGERMVAKGADVEPVVRAALASVERGDLYCVPMADGRWAWRLKRALPEAARTVSAAIAKRM